MPTRSAVIKTRRVWGWGSLHPFRKLFGDPTNNYQPYPSKAAFAVTVVEGSGDCFSSIEAAPWPPTLTVLGLHPGPL
jgi:hypothetical protein